ncbi:type II toxin-antitoxin system ParD family antitoxin [Brevundimonas sp.]|uniref:ribbon-helix-helix domain-containing protein n=1 Tax=Brevundimonas sp. TaxID=1871086 RepID=UPI00262227D8|nr:type II toxin-antitoxin system ParD family antitoxin [Brevundimonas sp.]
MATMNISLPDSLKADVDSRISEGGYGTGSEYVRDLIRRDLDRQTLRRLLLDGASSPPDEQPYEDWIESLRERIRTHPS